MRCRQCDYQLWNLEARRCPECGTPFLPSQYEFAPNRVCFCCPHCGQSYYGAGDKGHLVPREFDCVTCARHVDMDAMILRPAEGFDTDDTAGPRVPWLDRRRRGFWRGWLGTIGMALVKPGRLAQLLPPRTSAGTAAGFAVMTSLPIGAVTLLLLFAIAVIPAAFSANAGPGSVAAIMGFSVVALFLWLTAGMLACIGLWSLVTHGLLRVTGPTCEGLGRSFSCLCYASGAYVLTAIPCFGPYVGWIWWLVSSVMTVREGQRVSGARAAFAVLTPPLLLIGSVVALYVWAFVMTLSGSGAWASPQPPSASDNLSSMVVALKGYADSHNGETPVHSLRLLASGDLTADEFVSVDSPTMTDDVTIGEKTLEELQYLPEDQLGAAVQAAADRLPAGVVAHRVGDYVFTYHGINLKSASNKLWLVIESPEPKQAGAKADRTIRVIGADRIITTYTALAFDGALEDQNTRRRLRSLPPLPHPDTVTPDRPAAAPQPARDP